MKKNPDKRYEVDLYEPISQYFRRQEYEVKGEVLHCDLTAVKADELIIVELKRHLSVELLIQAAKRQRLTDLVYIAIPKPKYSLFSKKWQDICHLIRRLECGLLFVSFQKGGAGVVTEVFPPSPFDRHKSMQRSKKKRTRIIKEMDGRSGDYNVGGSHQTKIMTAYKENCIQIACFLLRFGPSTPKNLRQWGTGEKTLDILSKNYYGWFEKIQRGVFSMSEKGKQELEDYPELVEQYSRMAGNSAEIMQTMWQKCLLPWMQRLRSSKNLWHA